MINNDQSWKTYIEHGSSAVCVDNGRTCDSEVEFIDPGVVMVIVMIVRMVVVIFVMVMIVMMRMVVK